MRVTTRERSMLLVALDDLIVDYRKSERRARRKQMPATAAACAEAVARYTELAHKIAMTKGRPNGK